MPSSGRDTFGFCGYASFCGSQALFRLVYGAEQAPVPGYRELLPVLWELGILPDVHVLPGVPQVPGGNMGTRLSQTPEDAVQLALQGQWLGPQEHARARRLSVGSVLALPSLRSPPFRGLPAGSA
jgi:hypothetical protein